ncbi:MAG TPA: DNA-processing protein DprA [Dehalococcoidia bacterium]|nr:DNA-processing protein DprA [Dehalococcoidia bacterium]
MPPRKPKLHNDTPHWVAFNRIPGLGAKRYQALLARFGTLAEAWRATRSELKESGIGDAMVRTIADRRGDIDPEAEMAALDAIGARALTLSDPAYPPNLREVDDAPPVLYLRGQITEADALAVAVVGTRRPTPYGRQVAEEMSHQLAANGVCIVSGLARGIDGIAHRTALSACGRTLAVMASGLDVIYPPEHKRLVSDIVERGALISEQPLGTEPRGDFFPRRNRILSGLSLGVLVIEGDLKSGGLITANCALDQGREVFATPGSIFSSQSRGTNLKIAKGEAKLVQRVEDILEELNLTMVPQQLEMQEIAPATDTEAAILRHITREPVHIDEVCRESGMPTATVSSLLAMMELKGLIRDVGSKTYVRAREARAEYAPGWRRIITIAQS